MDIFLITALLIAGLLTWSGCKNNSKIESLHYGKQVKTTAGFYAGCRGTLGEYTRTHGGHYYLVWVSDNDGNCPNSFWAHSSELELVD